MLVYISCIAASSDWPPYANGMGSPLHMVHGPYTDNVQGVTLCGRRSVGFLPDGPHNEGNEWIQPDREHSIREDRMGLPRMNNLEPECWYLSTI
jgi:hypothetical protein